MKHGLSEDGSVSVFRKKATNVVSPFDRTILSHWVSKNRSIEGVHQIRCFPFLKTAAEPASEKFHNKIRRWTGPKKNEKVPEIHIPSSEPPELMYFPFTYLTFFEITVTLGSSVGIRAARVCKSEDFGLESQHRQQILLFSHLPNPL